MANFSSASVSIYMNNGNGTFTASGTITQVTELGYRYGDLNGDGKPDIAATSAYGQNVAVLINNGDGTFAPAAYYDVGARVLGFLWAI